MASAFLVQLPEVSGQTRYGGANAVVVYADDAAGAKTLAKAKFSSDVNAIWDGATATALTEPTDLVGWVFAVDVNSAAFTASHTATAGQTIDNVGTALAAELNASGGDLEGYVFTISIDEDPIIDISYTGLAGDGIDEVGDALVLLLNADAAIAGAEYTAATQTLKIAETTDGIGDATVTFSVTDPAEEDVGDAFRGTITDGGAAGAALSMVLLNTGFIFSAGYVAGTNVLTIAGTVDLLGDTTVVVTATLPGGASALEYEEDLSETGFFTSLTHEGSAGDALAVTLVNKSLKLFGVFKTV